MDPFRVFQTPPAAVVSHVMEECRVFPAWSFPRRLPSPSDTPVSHSLCGSGIQHVHEDLHEDETLNRDVYDALSTLEHVRSPLEEVTFSSLVSTLPCVVDYSQTLELRPDRMVCGDMIHQEISMNLTETQVHTPEVRRSPQFVRGVLMVVLIHSSSEECQVDGVRGVLMVVLPRASGRTVPSWGRGGCPVCLVN
jgi:hypothetical protein